MCGRLYHFPRGLVLYWVALASGFNFFHSQNFINLSCQLFVQFWKGRAMLGHGFINTITDQIKSLQQINNPKYHFPLINININWFVIYFSEFHLDDSNQFSFFACGKTLHGICTKFSYDRNAACCCQLKALHLQICKLLRIKRKPALYMYIYTGYEFQ